MKKTVYISGKITGLSKIEYEINFNKAERRLTTLGYIVVNPIKLKPFRMIKTWRNYMRTDISELCKCDEIWLMKNWWKSKGAKVELLISLILGIKVRWL